MIPARALALALPLVLLGACKATSEPEWGRPLPEGADALLPLGPEEEWPDLADQWYDREEVLSALDRSIAWTERTYAEGFFPIAGVDHERALASLHRFRDLLVRSASSAEFASAVQGEFTCYKSAGWDGRGGGVLFTAYCTPLLAGSTVADAEYRWPLYALPGDLVKGEEGVTLGRATTAGMVPYPSRRVIESNHLLEGQDLELVWLADPVDAFIAHVNGSAFVELPDGEILRFGYAGKNGREYRSLGKALIEDGVLGEDEVSLASIRAWARTTPEEEVLEYLHRNRSYVFFTPIEGDPHGSLDFDVTAERTLATDKRLFPRGAVVFVEAELPGPFGDAQRFERIMLDQDTGGAIRTAGRADIYLGVGHEAEARAGATRSAGQLYYLFLAE
jgi:membrane-bound lytic murein transglycosylase A